MIKSTKDKTPVLNKVPPNTSKSLNNDNLNNLLYFFNRYWLEETDFDEWHKGQIVPLPKSGDLSDPKKWRSVTLMDIVEKYLLESYVGVYSRS